MVAILQFLSSRYECQKTWKPCTLLRCLTGVIIHDVKLLLVQEAHSEAGSASNPRLSDTRYTTSDIIAPN